MTIIGLKQLRQNATQIVERVQKGESFTVVKRSKPVFDIIPSQSGSSVTETKVWTKDFIHKHRTTFETLAKE